MADGGASPVQTDGELIDYFNRRLTSLKSERQSWEPDWRELGRFFYSRSPNWFSSKQSNKGGRRNTNLVDHTPVFARTTLEAGMQSGLTNPARPWFRTTTPNIELMESTSVTTWLYAVDQQMRDILAKSNFYSVMQQQYGTWAVYGTISMLILDDDDTVVRFVPDAIGSYYLACNDKGEVDTRYKEWRFTVKQMVDKFRKENCSLKVQQAYDSKQYDTYYDVVHVLEPEPDSDRWRSFWYEPGEQKITTKAYFAENPLIAARWRLDEPDDVYGTPPALACLGSAKSLQVQQKRKAQAIDKHVDPPLVGNAKLKNATVSTAPGTITYSDFAQNGSAPQLVPLYQHKPEIQAIDGSILDDRDQIKDGMFTKVFLMLTGDSRSQPPTAEEIRAREGERMLLLGPVIQNGDNEIFQPVIDRLFSILVKRSEPYWKGVLDGVPLIPAPPEELADVDLKVDLISVLAQAQKAVALQGIERLGVFVSNAAVAQGNAAASGGEAMDKLDVDQMIDEYANALGTPPTIIRSDDDVLAIRDARAKKQEQAQKAAQAEQQAKAVAAGAGAAKDLSETKMGQGSALDAIGQAAAA
jgi:hypothetical protein